MSSDGVCATVLAVVHYIDARKWKDSTFGVKTFFQVA
jgi:hypothetical protein